MQATNLFNKTGRNAARLYAGIALGMDLQRLAPLPQGAKIIAANHPSSIDPFMLMGLSDEPIHILIAEMCFQMPMLGRFLRAAGHIPVVAESKRTAFETALALLASGKVVGIFPEGGLSPLDGGTIRGCSGVARLALATGVPVIPAGIALQRDHILFREARGGDIVATSRLYFRGPYAVTMGRPLRLVGAVQDHASVRLAVQEVMGQIAALTQMSETRLCRPRPSEGSLRALGRALRQQRRLDPIAHLELL